MMPKSTMVLKRTIAASFLFGLVYAGSAVAGEAGLSAAQAMDAVMWGQTEIGGPFELTDHTGKPRTEADLKGKVSLVYFGFAYCPDICPVDLANIGGALTIVDTSEEAQAFFVTIDPERDATILPGYVEFFHEDLIGLTGDAAAVRTMANAYQVYYQKVPGVAEDDYTMDHTAFTYLFDKTGAYRGFFPPGTEPSLIAEQIRPLLDDPG